jgi:hypothetical protein
MTRIIMMSFMGKQLILHSCVYDVIPAKAGIQTYTRENGKLQTLSGFRIKCGMTDGRGHSSTVSPCSGDIL